MTEKNPALFLQARTDHKADMFRLLVGGLLGRMEGVFGPTDLVVSQDTGSNMNSKTSVGGAFMFGDANIAQGMYMGYNDAAVTLTHSAAPGTPGQSRWDLVCARTRDNTYDGSGVNAWDIRINAGAASATPSDPALADNEIALARVVIDFGQTTVTTGDITDLRPRIPLGILPMSGSREPGDLYSSFSLNSLGGPAEQEVYEGLFGYDLVAHALKQYNTPTTGWTLPWALPWGVVSRTIDNGTTVIYANDGGDGSERTALVCTAFPAVQNRLYRVEALVKANTTLGANGYTGRIRAGVTEAGAEIVGERHFGQHAANFPVTVRVSGYYSHTTASASTQLNLTLAAFPQNYDINGPSLFLVEDMGPSGAPA